MAAEQIDKTDVANSSPLQAPSDELRRMVEKLLAQWMLTPAQCDVLLSSSCGNERLTQLLTIHQSLRTLFPRNQDLTYRWMTTPNRAFSGRTPIEVVAERGPEGLAEVKAYLEGAIQS
ncbi:MAG: MbcA/ParS/Xre antitoxin family protein [Pseudomonadota bacterium]